MHAFLPSLPQSSSLPCLSPCPLSLFFFLSSSPPLPSLPTCATTSTMVRIHSPKYKHLHPHQIHHPLLVARLSLFLSSFSLHIYLCGTTERQPHLSATLGTYPRNYAFHHPVSYDSLCPGHASIIIAGVFGNRATSPFKDNGQDVSLWREVRSVETLNRGSSLLALAIFLVFTSSLRRTNRSLLASPASEGSKLDESEEMRAVEWGIHTYYENDARVSMPNLTFETRPHHMQRKQSAGL